MEAYTRDACEGQTEKWYAASLSLGALKVRN